MLRIVLFSLVFVLAGSAICQGGELSEVREWDTQFFAADAPLTFQKFDNIGGTRGLQSILVRHWVTGIWGYLGGIFLDNDGPYPAECTATYSVSYGISSTDVPLVNTQLQTGVWNGVSSQTYTRTLAADNGDPAWACNPMWPDGTELELLPPYGYIEAYVSPTLFDYYIGSGAYTVQSQIRQWADLRLAGQVESVVQPQLICTHLEIVYTYCIPEPASFTAVLSAFAVLGLIVRRAGRGGLAQEQIPHCVRND